MNSESTFNLDPKLTLFANKRKDLCNIFRISDPIQKDSDLDQELFNLISQGKCNLSDHIEISKNYNLLAFDKIIKTAELKYKTNLSQYIEFENKTLSLVQIDNKRKLNSYDDFLNLKNSLLTQEELSNITFDELTSNQQNIVVNKFIKSPNFLEFKNNISNKLQNYLFDNGFICDDENILNINNNDIFLIDLPSENIKCSASYFAEKCQAAGSEYFDGSLSDYGASGEFNLDNSPEDLKYILNGDLDERITNILEEDPNDYDYDELIDLCCNELYQKAQDSFEELSRNFCKSYSDLLFDELNTFFNENHNQLVSEIFSNKSELKKHNSFKI